MEDFGLWIFACHSIRQHSARVPSPDGRQLSVLFPVLDLSLFGMWMSITCIDFFSVCLRKRARSVTFCRLSQNMFAHHALWGIKCWLEYTSYDILVRTGTQLLDELRATAGRAWNVGWERNEVPCRASFSICYFRCLPWTDRVGSFPRVPSRRFRSGLWKTYDQSINLIPCRYRICVSLMLLNDPIFIHSVADRKSWRCSQISMLASSFRVASTGRVDEEWSTWTDQTEGIEYHLEACQKYQFCRWTRFTEVQIARGRLIMVW
jgi:hypothetical protein